MAENILEINDLSVAAISKNLQQPILDKVSFCVPRNKVTGIAGESGSGKSLTALSIMGLCPPGVKIISGSVTLYDENEVIPLENTEMKNIRGKMISMIFQEPMTSLNPSMKCGLQVEEALRIHKKTTPGLAHEKVIQLFNEVKLPRPEKIFQSYPHQLSGGQRQRVMIAMALISNPKILIADEPTTALDVTVQKKILELLKEIMENHKLTIIFITHDLRLLKEFADFIIIMRNGKVMETGKSNDIYNFPKHPYTKGLIACQPPLDHKPSRLLTIQDFEEEKTPVYPSRAQNIIYTNTQPILSIKDLSVYFSTKVGLFSGKTTNIMAVENATIDVYPGETLGIVGESGCGKTSLGKAVLNLLSGTQGKILFKGTDISELKGKKLRQYRKKVQVVFQDPYSSLNPVQNIGDIITEPMRVHLKELSAIERKERCKAILEKVGLPPECISKYPHQFSGGQRQRIGIARCLAVEPELIILDEAVSALDVSVQAQILNLLNDLKNDLGLTYMFISHDLAVVKYMSDRIIVMKDGKIEETGEASEIYTHPRSAYTKILIDSIPGRI